MLPITWIRLLSIKCIQRYSAVYNYTQELRLIEDVPSRAKYSTVIKICTYIQANRCHRISVPEKFCLVSLVSANDEKLHVFHFRASLESPLVYILAFCRSTRFKTFARAHLPTVGIKSLENLKGTLSSAVKNVSFPSPLYPSPPRSFHNSNIPQSFLAQLLFAAERGY